MFVRDLIDGTSRATGTVFDSDEFKVGPGGEHPRINEVSISGDPGSMRQQVNRDHEFVNCLERQFSWRAP